MEQPIVIVKPSIMNALFPLFLRNVVYALLFVMLVNIVAYILQFFAVITYSSASVLIWSIVAILVLSIVPLLYRIFILSNTTYYFFNTHILSEFKFIMSDRHSLPYNQITNIEVDVSLWDRLCKAGDMILHTAQEVEPSLTLYYLKEPAEIERLIYRLAHKIR